MPNRIYESMTSVVTATGWAVRVWWTTASFEVCFGENSMHGDIIETVRAHAANPESIRAALEAMDGAGANLAAFEIKDAYGNGGVIYPDWN